MVNGPYIELSKELLSDIPNTGSVDCFTDATRAEDLKAQIAAEKGKQKMLKARLDLFKRDDKAALEKVINGIASASPKPK